MKDTLRKRFQSDWFAALALLTIFLILKGYKFGWDDQHLEIPLLKSLIDKTLYVGDYYVESLKQNFVSYFYVLMAKIISAKHIPAAYLTLYLASKYFLFFWVYKLWHHISNERSVAFICTVIFMTFGRTPEFLYRTFSHQEFTLAIIFAGIYFFYTERFVLAAAVFGLGCNFHFLYSLFPMVYLGTYLLRHSRRYGWPAIIKSALAFGLTALPIIIWIFNRNFIAHLKPPVVEEAQIPWVAIYQLACPQNFIFFGITPQYLFTHFQTWLGVTISYFFLGALYLFNYRFNDTFRSDRKISVVSLTVVLLLAITYYFTYAQPNRLVLDLNLVRNTQYLFFFLMGYTAIFAMRSIDRGKTSFALIAAFFFGLLILNDYMAIVSLAAWALLLLFFNRRSGPNLIRNRLTKIGFFIGFAICLTAYILLLRRPDPMIRYSPVILAGLLLVATAIGRFRIFNASRTLARRLFIILPLITVGIYLIQYHVRFVAQETKGGGFWKLQRNWEDMQRFVQANTPKDATFLIPNDMEMGGFRILSERKVICCYRDCGIVGFDYAASIEWIKRLKNIESFKVMLDENGDLKQAIINAIVIYKADHIVFMKYYAPKDHSINFLQKIYENESFSLYRVLPNFSLRSLTM